MTKDRFIEALRARLSHLPNIEIDKHLSFYMESVDDRIEDGMTEEEAVNSLGHIDDIAKTIEQSVSLPVLFKERIKESHNKSNNKILWVALIILGSPVWLPLIFAFISVILTMYIVVWSMIFVLFVLIASLAVFGIAGVFAAIANSTNGNIVAAIMYIGGALSIIGLSILAIKPVTFISKHLALGTKFVILKIKQLIIGK